MPKVKRRRAPEPPPADDPEQLEPETNDDPEDERPARVVPQVGADRRQRYEAPPDDDVFTIGLADYSKLTGFLDGLTDRDRYSVALWRCDPRHWSNKKSWGYLAPTLPVPEGTLEDAVAELHGPGVYRWQLRRDGKYLSAEQLPPSLRGAKLAGFVKIDGVPRSEVDVHETVVMPPGPDGQLELVRELLGQQREDAKAGRSEVAEILKATTEGFKAQMQGMVESMKAQNGFLQAQLEHQRLEAKERASEKDGMWKMLVEIQRDMREGDTRSTTDRVIESLPLVIDKLSGAGLFQAPSRSVVPKAGALPAPAPANGQAAPPMPERPMEAPTEQEKADPMFQYIAELINKLHNCFQSGLDPDLAAEALERIGTQEQFDWLMDQSVDTVTGTVDSLHKRFKGAPAPAELLDYTRKVWAELNKPDEPEAAPPAAPPAAPAVTPTPAPDSGTGGQGVQP